MSEQLLFMWSTFRYCCMGTKLKYFWKTHEIVMSAWIFSQNASHEQLLFTWSTFRDCCMGTKVEIFLKNSWKCVVRQIFSQKDVSQTITFHVIHISWLYHGYKAEIFFKTSWICEVRLNFFTKTCLTDNYFSRDPRFVIVAWVQSWNIFEKLMKLWSPPDFFQKNMSHEQLPFMWFTLRDSSMGTKLKYFWKPHETVKSARIFSQKNVSRTITFHVIHIMWF